MSGSGSLVKLFLPRWRLGFFEEVCSWHLRRQIHSLSYIKRPVSKQVARSERGNQSSLMSKMQGWISPFQTLMCFTRLITCTNVRFVMKFKCCYRTRQMLCGTHLCACANFLHWRGELLSVLIRQSSIVFAGVVSGHWWTAFRAAPWLKVCPVFAILKLTY